MKVFSYGGGVQSTAALVLAVWVRQSDSGDAAALRNLRQSATVEGVDILSAFDFPTFLFSNVGDDSERPETLAYVHDVATPYAAAHGVHVETIQKTLRTGEKDTLLKVIDRHRSSIPIPVRNQDGAPGLRNCTTQFKIDVVAKWLKAHGATPEYRATVGLGISLDEMQRMRTDDTSQPLQHRVYPLVDLRLTRQDCVQIILRAGLPVPPKSSCFFCPFNNPVKWQAMRRDQPELFAKSVALEQMLNERQDRLGKPHVWLTRKGQPLDQAIGNQATMDFEDACESGYCMT